MAIIYTIVDYCMVVHCHNNLYYHTLDYTDSVLSVTADFIYNIIIVYGTVHAVDFQHQNIENIYKKL